MIRLSYSLLSAFDKYLKEEMCGLLFRAVYIDKTAELVLNKEAMDAGKWFEHEATGYGEKIEPVRIKSGELNATYRVLEQQLENFKSIQKTFTDDVVYGYEMVLQEPFDAKGIFDIMTSDFIADIKVSGNINSRDEYGWSGDLRFKPVIKQAKMYVWLYWKASDGEILPFYFYVFSTKDSNDVKVFEINISEDTLIEFENYLTESKARLDYFDAIGFDAYPSLENCCECPLKETCEFFTMLPKVEVISI